MPELTLTTLDRRIVGNLSIPRNVDDLAAELRADARVGPIAAAAIVDVLAELERAGLVVNLGAHEDLAKLAASLERRAGARAMHDDKARNYVRRLESDRRAWRRPGDLYIYTDAAHELLTGPFPGLEPVDLTTRELELVIAREAQRVRHDLDERFEGSIFDLEQEPGDGLGGGRLHGPPDVELANVLLTEEFRAWESAVITAHYKRTGEQARGTIAGGSYGDATELLILAAEAGGTAYGETSPTFGALLTVLATDADTGATITRANYTGYVDKSIALADYNAPAAGGHTNLNPITWAGATAGTSTCIGFARVTTSGGGRLIRRASIANVIVSATNTPASIAAGALNDQLD